MNNQRLDGSGVDFPGSEPGYLIAISPIDEPLSRICLHLCDFIRELGFDERLQDRAVSLAQSLVQIKNRARLDFDPRGTFKLRIFGIFIGNPCDQVSADFRIPRGRNFGKPAASELFQKVNR